MIVNFLEIAKSLNRSQECLTFYFKRKLSCLVDFDQNNNLNVLYGIFQTSLLQEIIYEFIESFLLCSACKNQETIYEISKNTIHGHCFACENTIPLTPSKNSKSIFVDTIKWIKHFEYEAHQNIPSLTKQY